MNNPYRARPSRPRIDQPPVSNYRIQNNNIWPSTTGNQNETTPRLDGVYQPNQHQIQNQPQLFNDNVNAEDDSWNWDNGNTENNNDAWNWSIDQQQSVQLQSHNPLSYQNNENNYNVNNNRPAQIPGQQSLTDSVSKIPPTSELTSSHLIQQTNWSPVEQNKNLVYQNPLIGTSSNQNYMQNVDQQMVEKNIQHSAQTPAQLPLTDNVSKVVPTSELTSQTNWSPVEQNRNLVNPNVTMSNQTHLQNVDQQMINKNMQHPSQIPGQFPMTDNVSKVASTAELPHPPNWHSVAQNRNFIHPHPPLNTMSNQTYLQNSDQQIVEKNIQHFSQTSAQLPLTDNVSTTSPTSELTSSNLIRQQSWSPVEQNKNFVHPNPLLNTMSNQNYLQNTDQQILEKNKQHSLNAHMDWSQPQSISHEKNQLFDVNYQNLNNENSNKNYIDNIQLNEARKISLDDHTNQQLNEQPDKLIQDNFHSTTLQEKDSQIQYKSSNPSQSWQSNITQHSNNELNDNLLNTNSINPSKDWKKSESSFDYSSSTELDTSSLKSIAHQDNQTNELTNDIQQLHITSNKNNSNWDSLQSTPVEVTTNVSTNIEEKQNEFISINNQTSHNQHTNNYPFNQWTSGQESHNTEAVKNTEEHSTLSYHHSELSTASKISQVQKNTGVYEFNKPQTPPTTVTPNLFNPASFKNSNDNRQEIETLNIHEDNLNYAQYQSQHNIYPPHLTSQHYQVQQSQESNNTDNLSDVQSQNTVIDSSIKNSFQSNSQYPIVNDNIPSTGFDQWYNQTGSQPLKNDWYDNKNKSDKLQPELKKLSEISTTESHENIQTPIENVRTTEILQQQQQKIQDNLSDHQIDTKQISNVQQQTSSYFNPIEHQKQTTDDYEFASNDRNTFLETGELTDSHHESDSKAPSPDDTNDETNTNDIPFLREVPGQSSTTITQRNSPTGGKQYNPLTLRLSDIKRNEPFGHDIQQIRDIPSGQEKPENLLIRDNNNDVPERRDDPSGRERSLPLSIITQRTTYSPNEIRNEQQQQQQQQQQHQIKKRQDNSDNDNNETGVNILDINNSSSLTTTRTGLMNINDNINNNYDRNRIVTGSQEINVNTIHEQTNDTRQKREEAVGASITEDKHTSKSPKRKNSYDDRDGDESAISQDELNRERQKVASPLNQNRYEKINRNFYDREHDDYDDDYYYERNRSLYDERSYYSRDDLDNSDIGYRDNERRHRDNLDRPMRNDERIDRHKDENDRILRRRDNNQRDRQNNSIRRQKDISIRDYDSRYTKTRNDYSDRERRRDDKRRYYDDYDNREIRRDYYDDPYSRSSRPSSRSSYNDRERDYYRPSHSYYNYNSYDYQNYMVQLEKMRRDNPVAYAEWYNKYYRNQQQQQQHQQQHHHQHQHQQQQHSYVNHNNITNYHEDRGSVHSGRSSCDERTTNDKQTIGDISLIEDIKNITRMTPTKFSTSHGQGTFTIGSILHVYPSYPADGERARIDLISINNLLINDKISQDLRAYPGPLIKGVTHKKTIIDYCETQIKKALNKDDFNDPASYILIYQLMITLIQQNGNVVGVDIATLLLKNKELYPYNSNGNNQVLTRRESVISQRSNGTGSGSNGSGNDMIETIIKPKKTTEQITDEFRNNLLYGLVQESLEYAMTEGLWGHALFLASKLDKRTYASVMARFANSLPAQDPLQTLYQLHSGRIPASVTCIADSKWDDWRPHLAMIMSNTSTNPEIDYRSIIILGDTLATRGDLYAAHFCYLLAQIDFGMYESTNNKLVLIGANHHNNYNEFANLESIMLTEIYEYARSLSDPNFTIDGLQLFKFEIVKKLIDYGFLKEAFLYLEQISIKIINEPSKYKKSFINDVYNMSDRVKFHDPTYKDIADDMSLNWINNLYDILHDVQRYENNDMYQNNQLQNQDSNNYEIHYQQQQQQQQSQQYQQNLPEDQGLYQDNQQQKQQQQQQQQQQQSQPPSQWNYPSNQLQYDNTIDPVMEVPTTDMQQEQWTHTNVQDTFNADDNISSVNQSPEHNANQYNQWQYQSSQNAVDSRSEQQSEWNCEEKTSTPTKPRSQISMGPTGGKQYDPLEELDLLDKPKTNINTKNDNTNKNDDKQIDKKKSTTGDGGSWFNGLFSKLTLKPKNQMILPDDNNPAIVWDSVAQKWKNKDDNDDGNSSNSAPPPPKAKNINFQQNSTPAIEQTSKTIKNEKNIEDHTAMINNSKIVSSGNMFKLQKGRSMRANYIDVMNPGGNKNNGSNLIAPTPAVSPIVPMAASSPQLFNPSPINNTNTPIDFLTSGMMPIPNNDNIQDGNSTQHN